MPSLATIADDDPFMVEVPLDSVADDDPFKIGVPLDSIADDDPFPLTVLHSRHSRRLLEHYDDCDSIYSSYLLSSSADAVLCSPHLMMIEIRGGCRMTARPQYD